MANNKAIAITELTVDQEQRISTILLYWAIGTTCLSLMLGVSLVWLSLASQQIDVRVLTLNDASKQLVEVNRLRDKIQIGDPLVSSFGERIVTLLYTIDHQTEEARSAELGRYLSQELCNWANKMFDPADPKSFYYTMREGNFYKQIRVTNSTVLNKVIMSQGNIIRVEWNSTTRHGIDGEIVEQQKWITNINMDIQSVGFEEMKKVREFGYHLIGFVATKIQTTEITNNE